VLFTLRILSSSVAKPWPEVRKSSGEDAPQLVLIESPQSRTYSDTKAMALGILEPSDGRDPPGTVHIKDDDREQHHTDTHLKRDKQNRILNPQPSDDPNDPLNWPLWKRDLILAILSFVSVIAATTSPLLAADSVTLAVDFVRTFQDAALLTGYHLLGVGVAGFIFVASARIWGKRHLFLFGCLLMIAASAWGGSTVHGHSYKSLLWARVFQGVALAPFEALVNACVGDLYFVHERGIRMALTNVSLFGGAFLTPVFVGMITHHIGWQWSFYMISIFMAGGLLLILFCVPETAYRRASSLNTDTNSNSSSQEFLPEPHGESVELNEKGAQSATTASSSTASRKTFVQNLMPFDGRKTDESFFKLLLRPFPLFLHPGIAWACLTQGVIIGWTVMVGVIIAAVFLGPPLFLDEEHTGYIYTAAFIGSLIGLILSGVLSDSIANAMTRLNHGKYEPEFRILLVLPMLVCCGIGLYGFGMTTTNVAKYGEIVPEVFLAFIIVGMVMGAVASALYIVDAHREIAVEAFTCLLIFKNMFSFGMTFGAYNWLFSIGIRKLFIILGSIQAGICLLAVPMYVFGKRNRGFMHRHDLLRICGLR
jgi:MFS family permease